MAKAVGQLGFLNLWVFVVLCRHASFFVPLHHIALTSLLVPFTIVTEITAKNYVHYTLPSIREEE